MVVPKMMSTMTRTDPEYCSTQKKELRLDPILIPRQVDVALIVLRLLQWDLPDPHLLNPQQFPCRRKNWEAMIPNPSDW